jgi:hypothetical protein
MSRPARSVVAAMAITASIIGPTTLHAQASPRLDSLLRHVQSLDSSLIVQGRVVDSVRRSLVSSVPSVDVHYGALRVRTTRELEKRVGPAVQSVATLIERQGGPPLASRVASHVPMITRDSAPSIFGPEPLLAFASDTLRRWSSTTQRPVSRFATTHEIADALTGMVEQFALQGADSALAAWIMVGRLPLRPTSASESADAYIEMVTVESIALRRCQSGDTDSCLDVLGIDSLPGSRLTRWYAPADYRSMLRAVAPPREDSVAVAAWIRCRQNRDQSACAIAAAALPNDRVPLPLSATARLMFLREALAAGGTGAYGRLVDGGGSVRVRLTRAAAEPLDRTAARWRSRLAQSRPDRMQVPAGLVLASLGWTGALLGVALIRRGSWV